MSDASLRDLLRNLDGSSPSIQNAASAMMKHYDRSAPVAVTEWRNALQNCRNDQLLPLVYVANEVLQISKRNRGSKFLEAFSPMLGQALRHICTKDKKAVEKVRRVVKIWGERYIFSVRFVNELIHGLDTFRKDETESTILDEESGFSPDLIATQTDTTTNTEHKINKEEEDLMKIVEQTETNAAGSEGESEEEEEDLFMPSSDRLDTIPMDAAALVNTEGPTSKYARRRTSLGSQQSQQQQQQHKKRRKTTVDAQSLVQQIEALVATQQDMDLALLTLKKIDSTIQKTPTSELENLVGDELQMNYRQVLSFQKQLVESRRTLYQVAQNRHKIGKDLVRYLPWLEKSIQQDDDDLQFCDQLETKLQVFQPIHQRIRNARDIRLGEERQRREEEERIARKKREEEENEKFRKAALEKQTEAKPGMVWNPVTREYEMLNTNEDWRDH